MAKLSEVIQLENRSGQPYVVGGTRVTPHSQALTIRLPFFGFVYNRPTSVVVERDGETTRVPIVDVTRLALIALWAFGLVFGILFINRMRR